MTYLERAKALVAQMTLEEKMSQMKYDAPAIERLGVQYCIDQADPSAVMGTYNRTNVEPGCGPDLQPCPRWRRSPP